MQKIDFIKLLNNKTVTGSAGNKAKLKTEKLYDNLFKLIYVYKRPQDKKYRKREIIMKRYFELTSKNVYRLALVASEGSHLSTDGKSKNNYFKYSNTNSKNIIEGLSFLKYLNPKLDSIRVELRYPPALDKNNYQLITYWSSLLKLPIKNFIKPTINKQSAKVGCGLYLNSVYLPYVVDFLIKETLSKVEKNKILIISWLAGRIDGDGTVHPKNCRVDIAYHKKDEIVLLKKEKKFLKILDIAHVKDKISNKKQLVVLQICGLDNLIKLFDGPLSLENKLKIISLLKKRKFYFQLNDGFRKSLSKYNFHQRDKKNWNRYLNGSRKIPFSILNNVFSDNLSVKNIEKIRYGSKTIDDEKTIKQILNKFMEVNEKCVA